MQSIYENLISVAIYEYKVANMNIRSSPAQLNLKLLLLKTERPIPNLVLGTYNPDVFKLLTILKLGISYLRLHKVETYFLRCPLILPKINPRSKVFTPILTTAPRQRKLLIPPQAPFF